MGKLAERFERVLEHWVHDVQVRENWRAFFYHGAAQPDQPRLVSPLFRGSNEAGASVEVNESGVGGYDVLLDGIHAGHYEQPWQQHTDRFEPVVIGEWTCQETFAAPEEAREALELFLDNPGSDPPWQWAPALFEDGLIATAGRGARAAAEEPSSAIQEEQGVRLHYCVLLVNAGRSRVFTLESNAFEHSTTFETLSEVADTSNSLARSQDSQVFADSRPGLRREGPHGPRHAVSDRRENYREQSQRQYLQRVVDVASTVWGLFDACQIVVVASPQMLARLRPLIAQRLRGKPYFVIDEYPADLMWQEAAAVHDTLAEVGLLPARGRKPPVFPMRTPNPWQDGS
jgi:protein required for attachment to host cells